MRKAAGKRIRARRSLKAAGIAIGTIAVLTPFLIPEEPAAATPAQPTSVAKFSTVMYDDFKGTKLNTKVWRYRRTGKIVAKRFCAVPAVNNNRVSGGSFHSIVRPATAAEASTIRANAIKAQIAARQAPIGCPNGTFTYAMVGADKKLAARVDYGRLTARVKNPTGQGPYGAVWLRSLGDSTASLVSEIDMFESWGYGRGITDYIHYRDSSGTLIDQPEGDWQYVVKRFTDVPSWWTKWHTFSVTWMPDSAGQTIYSFTVDNQYLMAQMAAPAPQVSHYVVISNILSTWTIPYLTEPSRSLPGVKPAKLPQEMLVDWVRLERLVSPRPKPVPPPAPAPVPAPTPIPVAP